MLPITLSSNQWLLIIRYSLKLAVKQTEFNLSQLCFGLMYSLVHNKIIITA